ncbi:MAG: hypothetical protein FWD04_08890, partial [Conexibacteraceae bacterium]|nr:hypothetical protein [Conexibacteraceae bacterium]
MNGRHWLGVIPIALAVAGLAALPTGALASAVPGATYTGKASDGAIVTLTVSSDGTTVTSYSVLGIYGADGNGRMCQDSSSLGPTGWAGAPISNETFQSSIEDTLFSIQGAFGASQSVSGTFQLAIPPTQNGGAGCSTGSVSWTATVASSSGSGGNGGNNGGGGGSSGG